VLQTSIATATPRTGIGNQMAAAIAAALRLQQAHAEPRFGLPNPLPGCE
jgi:hypothetical protein